MFSPEGTEFVGYNPEFLERVRAKRMEATPPISPRRSVNEFHAEAEKRRQEVRRLISEKRRLEALIGTLSSSIVERNKHLEALELIEANLRKKFPRKYTFRRVCERARRLFGYRLADLVERNRSEGAVLARQFVMYWTVRLSRTSMAEVGRMMDRDHTTVMFAVMKYVERREKQGRALRRISGYGSGRLK